MRVLWWGRLEGLSWSETAFPGVPDLPVGEVRLGELAEVLSYGPEEPPVFFDHYKLKGRRPGPEADNVATLDYGLGHGGPANVCVAALRNVPRVVEKLASVSPNDCAVSMVSVQELFAAVFRCRESERERRKVEAFLEPVHLLPFDWDSAVSTARIRYDLGGQGIGIGPYDSQLAGQAFALDLILVTHNTKEFGRVGGLKVGLKVEDWENEAY